MPGTPRPLMVTFKLEKPDAVQLLWKQAEKRPARGYSARLRGIVLNGSKVDVDTSHISHATVPLPAQGPDRYELIFLGYFEVAPDNPAHAALAGKKGVPADFEFGFVDPAGGWATEGTDYEVLSRKPATLSVAGR